MHVRALLLDGSIRDEMRPAAEASAAFLGDKGITTEVVRLRERRIGQCRGCLDCWVKTPGACTVADEAEDVLRSFARSDVIVLLTPVTFGGHSSQLKKALDRMRPLTLPYVEAHRGEVRHLPRYDHVRHLVLVGLLPQRDDEASTTFRELAARNASALGANGSSMALVFSNERPEMASIAVREAFREAGMEP